MEISKFIHQSTNSANKLLHTIPFIVNNKLWVGFFKHRLVLTISILAAIVIPWSIYDLLAAHQGPKLADTTQALGIAAVDNSISINRLFEGANQNLILILIHMLNVYFSNKTIEKLSGTIIDLSVKEMIYSQFRNITVIIRNWFFELVIGIGLAIGIGIFGPEWLEEMLKFAVGSYFLGYLFLDNYNGAFGVTIKDSFNIIKRHAGAALTIGLVAKVLLLLPFVGAVLMSFICGVAGTWYMHTSEDAHAGNEAYAA